MNIAEATMTFDDLSKNISPELAAARGDLHESTEIIDPFDLVEKSMNVEDGVLGVIGGDKKDEGKGAEGEGATGAEGKGKEGKADAAGKESANQDDDLGEGLGEGQVENVPYPRFSKVIAKNQALKGDNETLKSDNEKLRSELEAIRVRSTQGEGSQAGDVDTTGQQTGKEAKAPAQVIDKTKVIKDRIAELSREHSDAVIDGDTDKAAEIMSSLMEHQAELSSELATQKIDARTEQQGNQSFATTLIDRHAEYFKSQDNLDAFAAVKDNFILNKGMSLKDALTAAEKIFFPGTAQVDAGKGEGDGVLDTEGKVSQSTREQILANQRKDTIKRNVDTHNSQPPRTSKTGTGNRQDTGGAKNALTMSKSEIDGMSKEEKALARGDVVN